LGWIPVEWHTQRLADFTASDITYGIVQAGPHIEGGIPYIRTGDMSGEYLERAALQCTSIRIAKSYSRSEVRTGDIVMAIRATVGKVLPVPVELDGANLTQGTARIAPNADSDPIFLLWALRYQRTQDSILAEIKGTTFAEITLAALREIPVAAPVDLEEQRIIAERMQACECRIDAERQQLQKLKHKKSGLMDDLLTGRVRVTPLLQTQAA
jgi:type I restriction enzyme S subunit